VPEISRVYGVPGVPVKLKWSLGPVTVTPPIDTERSMGVVENPELSEK
jgi:hypothetical protein